MIAIPTGTSATPTPCRDRARINKGSALLRPPSNDPATETAKASSSIRRLPYMSASRDTVGVATAPANRVEVTSHDALLADVSNRRGSSASSGRKRV